jgi:hypothetical protein
VEEGDGSAAPVRRLVAPPLPRPELHGVIRCAAAHAVAKTAAAATPAAATSSAAGGSASLGGGRQRYGEALCVAFCAALHCASNPHILLHLPTFLSPSLRVRQSLVPACLALPAVASQSSDSCTQTTREEECSGRDVQTTVKRNRGAGHPALCGRWVHAVGADNRVSGLRCGLLLDL